MAERPPIARSLVILESLQLVVLSANLAWTTLCLGGYRPETMVVTSLLTGLLLLLHVAARGTGGAESPRLHRVGWMFLPFLAYAAANVLWVTPVPWLGWHDWLWWAQMIAVFWVVVNLPARVRAAPVLLGVLALVGCVTVVMAVYQAQVRPDWLMLGRLQTEQYAGRASGSFGIPNSLAALLLLLLPPAVMLTLRRGAGAVERVACGYLAAVFLYGLILTASRGAWIALALILLAWPLTIASRGWGWRLRRLGVAALVLAALAATAYFTLPTLRERFTTLVREAGERTRPVMWRGAWKLFEEHPVWGSGAGSYNVAFERHRPPHFQSEPQWAHNDYLNTLSDYGLVGFLLFFGACGWLAVAGARRPAAGGAEAGAGWDSEPLWRGLALGMGAFALQLFVDFHFKIPALAMALACLAGLWVRQTWPATVTDGGGSRRWRQLAAVITALVLGGGFGLWVLPHYRAEALRYSARQAIDKLAERDTGDYRATLVDARAALARATVIDPGNAQAWADSAYATALWAHVETARNHQLGVESGQQAARAISLSKVVPEYWLRQAVALDMQGKWFEAGDSCIAAMSLAPNQAQVWYYYAYHLSLRPIGWPQARAAVEICLRLDPSNQPAQLLRQQLAGRNSSRQPHPP